MRTEKEWKEFRVKLNSLLQEMEVVAEEVCPAKIPQIASLRLSMGLQEGPLVELQDDKVTFRQKHKIPAYTKSSGDPLQFFEENWRRHFDSGEANTELLRAEADNLRQAIYAKFRGQPGGAALFFGKSPKSDLSVLTAEQLVDRSRARHRAAMAKLRSQARRSPG